MKLELTEGCNCCAYEVDNKPVSILTTQELTDLLQKQFEYALKEGGWDALYRLSYHLAEEFYDTYECSDEPCECCGDYVETYTMEI